MTLFGTAGIRGPVDEVTPSLALAVGQAAGEPGATFVVGRDGRETGPALVAAMEAGLESAGADVRRVGQVPTPALAYASRGRRGVMLTASHNPPADNGIKLFDDGVEYDSDAERAVDEAVAADDGLANWDEWGDGERLAVLSEYRDAVTDYVRTRFADTGTDGDAATPPDPLEGLRIAVDCGNGVGALATPQVLERLGATVVAVNASVDGHFPGRGSKPTPETLTEFSAFVADGEFDLGLAHDGDADRLVVLGPDGEVIHEDTILAVVAARYTADSDADNPVVVTTPNASARIDERVRAAGGRVERVRLGALHEGIARERERGSVDTEIAFAAEPWKHIHTAFGGWIDGVASAAVVAALVAAAGDTDRLREPVTERPYRKVSLDCPDAAKVDAMSALESDLPDAFPEAAVDTDYGVRLEFDDASWLLVRPSGTEPYVRLYAESESVDDLVDEAGGVIEAAIEDVR
ncbi:phosphoglucomutase/phosphomannomutase alpha/beta/alpha domain I [Natrinema pellirubrum DSM 15624]|uniref:Phosphomannomutase n=1 Tax=Natrinema pellirubrum (strain DSM 15624 / CIP 106293 / JCM 10476 / NCIMB 786 / 157) TaxID=797303 RepID=L0JIH3_NATP1|nr:phosphomannomutase [Natrinema pellirubrum]AGB31124.1 phosphomannomutase [Natrinema pellirubrum DSM 15624]ELY81225.1 phosphoglucomutase/phosphomannomutase alpha/beta/alpha domain I [Natrinema pellirubrum DSM 15624]